MKRRLLCRLGRHRHVRVIDKVELTAFSLPQRTMEGRIIADHDQCRDCKVPLERRGRRNRWRRARG